MEHEAKRLKTESSSLLPNDDLLGIKKQEWNIEIICKKILSSSVKTDKGFQAVNIFLAQGEPDKGSALIEKCELFHTK